MIHTFKSIITIPESLEKTWSFFSAATNLAKITPPEMEFKILTDVAGKEIYNGMIIDYVVKPLFSIPLHWKTEIINVDRLNSFTDRQLKGPYKIWNHTHSFKETLEGTLVEDVVEYELPFGFLGEIAYHMLVKNKIQQIFTYREKVLRTIFASGL